MLQIFLNPILHIAVLLPFIFFFLKDKSKTNLERIGIFALVYYICQICLVLPRLISAFNFINSSWNCDGKIIALIWAVVAYFLFRKYFKENDFFTFKQNQQGFKPAMCGAIMIIVLSTVVWFILGNSKFDLETLAFQLTIPGFDEEMIYRGILFGLLLCALKEKSVLGNPAILLTSVLFGIMHALSITSNWSIEFDPMYFLQTGFAGYIWSWVTLKSRSLVLAIASHNLSNFLGTLAMMLK